ncbi:Peroxidasin, partial [Armadillidium vulgare]
FQTKQSNFGLDLVAINIQRGRDHGIPSYNELRRVCGLQQASSFEHLQLFMPSTVAKKLKFLYKFVDDIDPFIGGISEYSVPGGIVGPTFRCIISEQFRRLKEGDRFYYENEHEGGFSQ